MIILVMATAILISLLVFVFIGRVNKLGTEKRELLRLWESGAYDESLRISGEKLANKPMDYFLLSIYGFSAYQMAIAQINAQDTMTFIDECVWSLRKALLTKKGVKDPRIFYVLGKAYYYKGPSYADLAVAFLEKARDSLYKARDIPEYLGLAYAAIHDYRSSVAAFTLALNPGEGFEESPGTEPSDLLFLSIARSYREVGDLETAKAYLLRCIEISRDSSVVQAAKLLLAVILGSTGKTAEAEALYLAILEEDGDNAEANFQLGELYAAGGDTTRARARWRRAAQTHSQAWARLNNM
jgi:tetratricopeptide (TPR) repeat protein